MIIYVDRNGESHSVEQTHVIALKLNDMRDDLHEVVSTTWESIKAVVAVVLAAENLFQKIVEKIREAYKAIGSWFDEWAEITEDRQQRIPKSVWPKEKKRSKAEIRMINTIDQRATIKRRTTDRR